MVLSGEWQPGLSGFPVSRSIITIELSSSSLPSSCVRLGLSGESWIGGRGLPVSGFEGGFVNISAMGDICGERCSLGKGGTGGGSSAGNGEP